MNDEKVRLVDVKKMWKSATLMIRKGRKCNIVWPVL